VSRIIHKKEEKRGGFHPTVKTVGFPAVERIVKRRKMTTLVYYWVTV
jgi:hypothetical protein